MSAQQELKAKHLAMMFPTLEQSVCVQVLTAYKNDVDMAIDHLLTLQMETGENGGLARPKPRDPPSHSSSPKLDAKEFLESAKKRREAEERLKEIDSRKQELDLQVSIRLTETMNLRKLEEERRMKEETERLEFERIKREEEDRWRKEMQNAAELRKQKELEDALLRINKEKRLSREEKDEKRRKEMQELRQKDEERKKLLQDELLQIQMERRRLAEERNALNEKLAEAQKMVSDPAKPEDVPSPNSNENVVMLRSVPNDIKTASVSPLASMEPLTQSPPLPEPEQSVPDSQPTVTLVEPKERLSSTAALLASEHLSDVFESEIPQEYSVATSLPLFTIYITSSQITKAMIDSARDIERYLLEVVQVRQSDIRKLDLANDAELKGYIKLKCGGSLNLPAVFVQKHHLGGVAELKKSFESGELTALMKPSSKPFDPDEELSESSYQPHLNLFDKALEGAENLFSYLNPLSWIRWGSDRNQKGGSYQEFDVVHTNWYWRHLRRRFRFGETAFLRIHPVHLDVRGAHRYEDIQKVTIVNAHTIVFHYGTGAAPDWLRCTESDLKEILSIVSSKVRGLLIEDLSTIRKRE